jgi:hypothetical protein
MFTTSTTTRSTIRSTPGTKTTGRRIKRWTLGGSLASGVGQVAVSG